MDNGTRCYHRFLDGDEDALEEIVDMYNRKLILFINRRVNNLCDAEDLAAEAFLDLIKKQSRHASVPMDDIQLADKKLLLDELEWDEQQKALLCALDDLHPDYRDAYRAKNPLRAALQQEVT